MRKLSNFAKAMVLLVAIPAFLFIETLVIIWLCVFVGIEKYFSASTLVVLTNQCLGFVSMLAGSGYFVKSLVDFIKWIKCRKTSS